MVRRSGFFRMAAIAGLLTAMPDISMRLSLPCFADSKADEVATSNLSITIYVFNFARAPLENWKSAQIVAARIFDRAGIETVWMDCTLSSEGRYLPPDCALPPQPTDIILRLVPTSRSTRAHFGNAMGIAAPSEKGTPASASVFYDRVEELAKGGAAPVAVILGHVAAHELGHLLLGSNSHSPMGLMRARWSRQDLRLATIGELLFRRPEAISIRQNVLGRIRNLESIRTGDPFSQ